MMLRARNPPDDVEQGREGESLICSPFSLCANCRQEGSEITGLESAQPPQRNENTGIGTYLVAVRVST